MIQKKLCKQVKQSLPNLAETVLPWANLFQMIILQPEKSNRPGCGNGLVTASLLRTIETLGLAPEKVAIVSGIGCSSRAAGYLNFQTLHTTHGRALAFATGLKMSRPELTSKEEVTDMLNILTAIKI